MPTEQRQLVQHDYHIVDICIKGQIGLKSAAIVEDCGQAALNRLDNWVETTNNLLSMFSVHEAASWDRMQLPMQVCGPWRVICYQGGAGWNFAGTQSAITEF